MDEMPMKVILNNATVGNAYFISKKNFWSKKQGLKTCTCKN